MNDRLKKILCTGIKILVCLAAIPVFFFLLVFFFVALSPESFLERPDINYTIKSASSPAKSPCSSQELLITTGYYSSYGLVVVRGKFHAYFPFSAKAPFPNDQPFSFEIPKFRELPPQTTWEEFQRHCLPLPSGATPEDFKKFNWTLLIEELVEQNTAPVGPALVRSQTAKKLTLLENPYFGTLLTFALYGLGFAFFTYRVFRNPNPTVPPTCKLFLFPFIVSFFLNPFRVVTLYKSLSLSDSLPLEIPFPFWFTYPFLLVCYLLRLFAPKGTIKPNDFWSRTFFFFFAEGFLGWALIFSDYGLASFFGKPPLFPLRPLWL